MGKSILGSHIKQFPKKIQQGNVHALEKSEQVAVLEEELNPMSYAKVFAKERFIINRPNQEFKQAKQHTKIEYLENYSYQANLERDAKRARMIETRSVERMKQL